MNIRVVRNTAFHLHRWLGLVGGALLCIAGLTGSILVFWREIDRFVLTQRFGEVVPDGVQLSITKIAEMAKAAYAGKGFKLESIDLPRAANQPFTAWFKAPTATEQHWQVLLNPYTGQIMGDRIWETSWVGWIYDLHFKLLAGDPGMLIMGIVALLTLILSITGVVLWPGWRKLMAGFKIKWNAHPKRVNFDIHKVAGIITAVFLAFIGFTGFYWNVPQAHVETAIYAATFTPKPKEPVSKPVAGKSPLAIAEVLQRADAAMPNAKTEFISFPEKPEGVFTVGKRQPQETGEWTDTRILLDAFSGEVLQVNDGLKPSRAESILMQMGSLHFGTFWGFTSKIFYVFVGLAPTLLMGTGVVMWMHRRRPRLDRQLEEKVMAEIR
jgi:uncharacterized iron-regulated membrane protein